MEPRLIEIFVESARSVLESLGLAPLTVGEITLVSAHRGDGEVRSCVSLAGEKTVGNMLVGFERETVLAVASAMLCEQQEELNDDVLSVVGEVTNMVCGDAKRRLSELGIVVGMARPELLPPGAPAPELLGDGEAAVFPCSCAGGAFYVSVDFGAVSSGPR
jgi:chemotaxis protein CheX